ncbi:unnamed protein product [Gordionus sp. m RMFG-2023]
MDALVESKYNNLLSIDTFSNHLPKFSISEIKRGIRDYPLFWFGIAHVVIGAPYFANKQYNKYMDNNRNFKFKTRYTVYRPDDERIIFIVNGEFAIG